MEVHSALSGIIEGFGYDEVIGVLRVVIKGKAGLKTYDYYGVTKEDADIFAAGLGKALEYIKDKYKGEPVTDQA